MAYVSTVRCLLKKITTLIRDESNFLIRVKDQIDQLQNNLEWISQSIKEDEALITDLKLTKPCVKQVRSIIFISEDVIDEFFLEIVRHKQFQKGSISSVKELQFVNNLGIRIDMINSRVNDLKANKEKYSSERVQITGGAESSNQVSSLTLQQKIERTRAEIAAEEYQDAIHIHQDIERQVMSSLRGNEGGNNNRLRIISIIGMGGVGKTTLSRKVFNVTDIFDCRAFVYISKTYSSQELLKSIMNQCFGFISNENEQLSNAKLYAHLMGKKYFIVLDDVWDTKAWEGLKSSFPDEQKGSRVLVTTRHKSVANWVSSSSSNDIHELAVINEAESWRLFLKKVFPFQSIDTSKQVVREMNVDDLGKQMVKKCYGLPLAIVFLARLLYNRDITRNVWRGVNESASRHLSQGGGDQSFKCSGILALSYHYLPYYLKPCFLYMSLFPKDSGISTRKLFQYWIAEGFVQNKVVETLEDTAEDYLEELISRSLIKVKRLRCDGKVKTCGIHNLLRDISIAESEENQFSQIYGSIEIFYQNQSRCRRVAVYRTPDESNELHLSKSGYAQIRSLMIYNVHFMEKNYLSSLFGGFRLLRVLELYGYTEGRVSLPKEVGELLNLRYLSLEKTKLEKIDPSYLSKLVNLETLNLKNCITELKLDDEIWSMRLLRNLYLDNIIPTANKSSLLWTTSTIDFLDIGNLANLQLLVIQAGDWIHSGGLKRLSSLRKLRIEECLNSHSDNISTAVVNLTELRSLALISKTSSTPLINEGIPLASIQFSNHKFLKKLHVKGHIHGWSNHIFFPPNLCKLKLEWSWITEDPMTILEKLPCLTFLHLGFDAYVGKRMVCSEGGFVNLQTLEIFASQHLEEWIVEEGALKYLGHLEIHECRRLNMIPDGLQQLTTLKILKVTTMPLPFQSRMTKEVGEDWYKIQHIPNIFILGDVLHPENSRTQNITTPNTEKLSHMGNLENVRGGTDDVGKQKLKDKQHLEDLHPSSNPSSNDDFKKEQLDDAFEVYHLPDSATIELLSTKVKGRINDAERQKLKDKQHLGDLHPSTKFPPRFPPIIEFLKEQHEDPSQVYKSPSVTIDRYLVNDITSGTPEVSNFENMRGGMHDAEKRKLEDTQHLEDLHPSLNDDCKEEQWDDPSEVYQSSNAVTIDSRVQDIRTPNTEKFLHISNLENVSGGIEKAERENLKDSQHLEHLQLSWNYSFDDDNDDDDDGDVDDRNLNDGMVFEGLQPHPNLKMLTITGFRGLKFPEWMGSSSNCLPNLVELNLLNCNSCEKLPALGMLPCLRNLEIKGMHSVKCLGQEFYYKNEENSGSCTNKEIKEDEMVAKMSVFPSLIKLNLIDMPLLEEWAPPPHSLNSFQSLEILIVRGCLRLKSISLTSCSSLKSLELCNINDDAVNSILASKGVERLTSLASVSIQDSPQLEFFPVVLLKGALLRSLKIERCSKFQGFRILDNNNNSKEFHAKLSSNDGFNTSISSLCSLKLSKCPSLTSLPDLRKWTSLIELRIENCDKLKESFSYDLASLPSLRTLYVDRLVHLKKERAANAMIVSCAVLIFVMVCMFCLYYALFSRSLY